jgi:hypothetical protein
MRQKDSVRATLEQPFLGPMFSNCDEHVPCVAESSRRSPISFGSIIIKVCCRHTLQEDIHVISVLVMLMQMPCG